VIALEHPEFQCSQIDLDPAAGPDEIQSLMEVIGSQDREDQIALRGGVCHVARLVHRTSRAVEEVTPSRAAERQSFELVIPTRGELNNLTLRPATRQTPARGAVEIQVFATGLNFRDVLNALGLYPGDPGPLGAECSGTITALGEGVEGLEIGNEVVALASGSFSSFVTTNAALVAPKPSSLSFEEAATIPLAFLTAYYALHHVAKVSAGDRVLIHAAAGGVGLAAVQLAHRAGAIVFGTASQSKWSFLQSLGVQHVMNSRTLDFRKEVMEHTGGRGVDIVLSSLAGEFIPASLSVLKEGGQFLELGKTGIWEKGRVAEFRNNISYSAIALDHVCAEDPALVGLMLRELMQAFQNGALKPLPKQVFPIQEVVQAFRHMAQAKHIGKIVVSQPDSIAATVRERHKPIRPDSTYLITGGLGALGFQVARWMVQKGARHLVLLARRGPSDSIRERIKELELAGAKVVVAQGDVSQERDVARVLATIADSMHPLRGIIHAAGVLDDGMLLHQDWSRFARVMAPKVEGSWNLHEQTRELPLDFFVCFSSAASILGSPGQGNYAAANAFIDTLAHARRMAGLPGLSIGWGPWSEAGMAAALGNRAEWQRTGVGIIAPEQGLHILEDLLQQTSGRVAVLPVNWSKFVHRFPAGQIPSLLSGIAHEMSARVLSSEQLPERSDILLRLEETPANRRRHLLEAHIRDHVTKVLGLDPSKPLNVKEPLKELGLDSLMAIELRNALGASLGRTLPATMLFDHPAIESLVRYLAGDVLNLKTGEESQPEAAEDEKQQVEVVAKLEQLSEDQAEALLIKKLGNASF
jgi:NADPH:quinone reductase-like Zn-dependent oxidoreductase/acyl carrier protein